MPDNNAPHPGDWYDTRPAGEPASAWYRAASERRPPAPPAPPALRREPTEAQRRHSRRMKVVSLTVCAVLLCAAAVLAFVDSGLARRIWRMGLVQSDFVYEPSFGYDFDFDFDYGDSAEDAQIGPLPEAPYEDFRTYFAEHFVGSGRVELPAAPTGSGMKLRLQPQRETELSLQQIYDAVSPAVVGITSYMDGEQYSWATGVVFDPDGYIITNTHVLQGCDGAKVVFADGTEYDAMLVGADDASDIAVLYVEAEESLPCAEFGRSDSLKVGDVAVAIGNPLSQDYTGTMTNGIISAIDRSVTYEGHTMTLLQTNAALNEGNSGGPLINSSGQVIGITNMKIMYNYYTAVEGIGFAIPSSVVKQIVDQLLETGVVPGEPTIGIVAGPVGTEAMTLYGLPAGLYVTEVSEGSDALEKGLAAGDVITAVNGRTVTSVAQVNEIKGGLAVGDSVTLSVWRDGQTLELEVALVDKADIK